MTGEMSPKGLEYQERLLQFMDELLHIVGGEHRLRFRVGIQQFLSALSEVIFHPSSPQSPVEAFQGDRLRVRVARH